MQPKNALALDHDLASFWVLLCKNCVAVCASYPAAGCCFLEGFCKCTRDLVAGIIAAFCGFRARSLALNSNGQIFEVPAKDVGKAEELANQLASLFTQSGSKRSDTRGTMRPFSTVARLRAGVSDVWHADL